MTIVGPFVDVALRAMGSAGDRCCRDRDDDDDDGAGDCTRAGDCARAGCRGATRARRRVGEEATGRGR